MLNKILYDFEDFNQIKHYSWYIDDKGYVKALNKVPATTIRNVIYLHRLIMKALPGQIVDHINGNKLDNRKANLRFVDLSQNGMNKITAKNNKSGFRGVCWSSRNKKWRATININKKHIHLGHFESKHDAVVAYYRASKNLFREYKFKYGI